MPEKIKRENKRFPETKNRPETRTTKKPRQSSPPPVPGVCILIHFASYLMELILVHGKKLHAARESFVSLVKSFLISAFPEVKDVDSYMENFRKGLFGKWDRANIKEKYIMHYATGEQIKHTLWLNKKTGIVTVNAKSLKKTPATFFSLLRSIAHDYAHKHKIELTKERKDKIKAVIAEKLYHFRDEIFRVKEYNYRITPDDYLFKGAMKIDELKEDELGTLPETEDTIEQGVSSEKTREPEMAEISS